MRNIRTELVHSWIAMFISLISSLLILPLVARTFDESTFGIYLYLLSAISLFITICDYGFNLTTTKKIAQATDARYIRLVVSQTIFIKLILIIISCLLCWVVLSGGYKSEILIVAILGSIGALQPSWYFLGLNKGSINDWLVAIGKIITAILVYTIISENSSLVDLIILHIIGAGVSLVSAWAYLVIKEKFGILQPSIFDLLHCLRSDFSVAMSMLVTSGYTIFPTILLGHISGMQAVYQYSSLEKIFKSIEYIITKGVTVIFPVVAKKYSENKQGATFLIRKLSVLITLIGVGIIIFSMLFGKQLLIYFYGSSYAISTELLLIMSTIPLLGSLSVVWGNLGVINTMKHRSYFFVLAFGSFLNLTMIILLAYQFGALGAAISIFISSCFIAYMMKRIFILNNK